MPRQSAALLFSSFLLARAWHDVSLVPRADNGLAKTPPMGWNSYNHYACVPSESIILSNAQAMVDLGLKDDGYYYVTTDCGWTVDHRTADGSLTWNSTLFPNGFPYVGQRIHELGLGFGVYSNAGIQMCMNGLPNQVGSLGYEYRDAEQFASWGADLLKYDNCYSDAQQGYPNVAYTPSAPIAPRFETMASALEATNRSIAFAICDWGVDFPSAWAPELGNTWRITNDIIPAWRTIARIINQAVPQTSYAGPGQWLDLDMLEIGNNIFTESEEQTHMSLWAIIKSPLIMGAALKDETTSISDSSLAIYKNKDAISYNQDSLGVAASFKRRWTEDEYEIWSGPLSDGRVVAALVNWANEPREMTLNLPVVGVQWATRIKSVWTGNAASNVLTSYTETVPAHGTMLLEIAPGASAGVYAASEYASTAADSTVFRNVYGITTSSAYTLTVNSEDGSAQQEAVSLEAGTDNTITVASGSVESITITPPSGTYYPSTAFSLYGSASRVTCNPGLCQPVGSKVGTITSTSGARLSISSGSASSATGMKYVEVDYINNDIALSTAWGYGTNTRNMTIAVNGVVTRIEVPLSGNSSEAFSPGGGWEDSATFGVSVDGFGQGRGNADVVEISNVGGNVGFQSWGADFVGLRVFW